MCISTEFTYQRAYHDKAQGGDLVNYLRCQKARRKRYASGEERRGTLAQRIGIGPRPRVVERRSRYSLACELASRNSVVLTQALICLLRPHRRQCHTLTFDSDKKFAERAFIADCLSAKVYFARLY